MIDVVLSALYALLTFISLYPTLYQQLLMFIARGYEGPRVTCVFNGKLHVIIPAKSEPLDVLLESMEGAKGLLNLGRVTYVLDGYDSKMAKRIVELAAERGFTALYRESPKGFKAGAINHALREFGFEDAVMVLDVDSYVDPNDVVKAMRLLCSYDAVIPTLRVKNCHETTFALGLCLGYKAFFEGAFKGLYAALNWTPILGSGSIIRSNALKALGLWPESILEDVELSLLMLINGFKVAHLHEFVVYTEVPPTYYAFIRQQIRWSYGSADVLRRYFTRLIRIKKGLLTLPYLMQYGAFLVHMASMLLLSTLTFFGIAIRPWVIVLLAAYAAPLLTSYSYAILKGGGLKDVFALSTMGIAYLLATPRIAFAYLLGLLGLKKFEWIPTPKGNAKYTRCKGYTVEYVMAVLLTTSLIYAISNSLWVNALLILPYAAGYIRGVWRLLKGTL